MQELLITQQKYSVTHSCIPMSSHLIDKISLYTGIPFRIDLTQQVHDYQKNQSDRKKDRQYIQRTRLTREYFCPRPEVQAEKIWQFANSKENKGQHLLDFLHNLQ